MTSQTSPYRVVLGIALTPVLALAAAAPAAAHPAAAATAASTATGTTAAAAVETRAPGPWGSRTLHAANPVPASASGGLNVLESAGDGALVSLTGDGLSRSTRIRLAGEHPLAGPADLAGRRWVQHRARPARRRHGAPGLAGPARRRPQQLLAEGGHPRARRDRLLRARVRRPGPREGLPPPGGGPRRPAGRRVVGLRCGEDGREDRPAGRVDRSGRPQRAATVRQSGHFQHGPGGGRGRHRPGGVAVADEQGRRRPGEGPRRVRLDRGRGPPGPGRGPGAPEGVRRSAGRLRRVLRRQRAPHAHAPVRRLPPSGAPLGPPPITAARPGWRRPSTCPTATSSSRAGPATRPAPGTRCARRPPAPGSRTRSPSPRTRRCARSTRPPPRAARSRSRGGRATRARSTRWPPSSRAAPGPHPGG